MTLIFLDDLKALDVYLYLINNFLNQYIRIILCE